jgi:hypothetical protein
MYTRLGSAIHVDATTLTRAGLDDEDDTLAKEYKTKMIPARNVAPRALGELLRGQPTSDAKIRFAWMCCVGPSIARATAVRLESSTGTLHVLTDAETWLREVSRSIPIVKRRLTELLGPGTVKHIAVKQRGPS